MGKGDIKTKKGKIANGSYGVNRPGKLGKTASPKPKKKDWFEQIRIQQFKKRPAKTLASLFLGIRKCSPDRSFSYTFYWIAECVFT